MNAPSSTPILEPPDIAWLAWEICLSLFNPVAFIAIVNVAPALGWTLPNGQIDWQAHQSPGSVPLPTLHALSLLLIIAVAAINLAFAWRHHRRRAAIVLLVTVLGTIWVMMGFGVWVLPKG